MHFMSSYMEDFSKGINFVTNNNVCKLDWHYFLQFRTDFAKVIYCSLGKSFNKLGENRKIKYFGKVTKNSLLS